MNTKFFLSAALALLLAGHAAAQVRSPAPTTRTGGGGYGGAIGGIGGIGGGIGGFGGGGIGGGGAGAAGTTRSYMNSTMLGDAMITSDMDSRSLIVVTDEDTFNVIKQVVAQLDQPHPQVLINCVIVQVTHSNELDLGAELSYSGPIAIKTNPTGTATTQFGLGLANPRGLPVPDTNLPDLGTGLLTVAPTAGAAANSAAPNSSGMFYSLVGRDVNATIHALAETDKTEVLSRPSVLTRTNQQATIMVGQTIPIITSSTISTLTNATTNTVEQQDIGIILKVTPFITREGNVEMILDPEISSLSSTSIPIGNGASYPVIDKISADTVVVTPNDQTVVIGGLMGSQHQEVENKVPILGDIPILGNAFKYKTTNKQKTELIVFLTPHIVNNPSELSHVSIQESGRLQETPKSFDKSDLRRYEATVQ
jgi:general secretion pathway protein D